MYQHQIQVGHGRFDDAGLSTLCIQIRHELLHQSRHPLGVRTFEDYLFAARRLEYRWDLASTYPDSGKGHGSASCSEGF